MAMVSAPTSRQYIPMTVYAEYPTNAPVADVHRISVTSGAILDAIVSVHRAGTEQIGGDVEFVCWFPLARVWVTVDDLRVDGIISGRSARKEFTVPRGCTNIAAIREVVGPGVRVQLGGVQ
jgi:hypothetical protein